MVRTAPCAPSPFAVEAGRVNQNISVGAHPKVGACPSPGSAGELLRQIEPATGTTKKEGDRLFSRTDAAREAGMSGKYQSEGARTLISRDVAAREAGMFKKRCGRLYRFWCAPGSWHVETSASAGHWKLVWASILVLPERILPPGTPREVRSPTPPAMLTCPSASKEGRHQPSFEERKRAMANGRRATAPRLTALAQLAVRAPVPLAVR